MTTGPCANSHFLLLCAYLTEIRIQYRDFLSALQTIVLIKIFYKTKDKITGYKFSSPS